MVDGGVRAGWDEDCRDIGDHGGGARGNGAGQIVGKCHGRCGDHSGWVGDKNPPSFLSGNGRAVSDHDSFTGAGLGFCDVGLDANEGGDAERAEVAQVRASAVANFVRGAVVEV